MVKKYEDILVKVKKQLMEIMGNGYSLTPAILKKKGGNKCEVYFAYYISGKGDISRPYIRMVADYETGVILEYQNAHYQEFADSSKFPLEVGINPAVPAAKTAGEQWELVQRLRSLHETVREFAFEDRITDKERKLLEDYRECFHNTVPAGLMEFCMDTEREFFSWMDKVLLE